MTFLWVVAIICSLGLKLQYPTRSLSFSYLVSYTGLVFGTAAVYLEQHILYSTWNEGSFCVVELINIVEVTFAIAVIAQMIWDHNHS